MRLFLDTHEVVWMDRRPDRLSAKVFGVWPKRRKQPVLECGKHLGDADQLGLGTAIIAPLRQVVEEQSLNGVAILPVKLTRFWMLGCLLCGDPFDRMLVAQLMGENI